VKYDVQTADVPFEDRTVDIHGIYDANGELILRIEELNEAGIEEVVRALNVEPPQPLSKMTYTFRHSTNGQDQGFALDDFYQPCTDGYLDNGEYCPLCNPRGERIDDPHP